MAQLVDGVRTMVTSEKQGLLVRGAAIVRRNLRYLVWFYLLNLMFAWCGARAFSVRAHQTLDHSLYADKLLHGMDVSVLRELFALPEFGATIGSRVPATLWMVLFAAVTVLLMPGVLLGYSSDHKISREEFFRACGHNVWRFVRLAVLFAIVTGIVAAVLFGILSAAVTAAEQTSHERLPVLLLMFGFAIIFVIVTLIRLWFDLAQVDVMLRDQGAVRKSVAAGLRALRQNVARLLGSYVAIALAGTAVLITGLFLWHVIVPPSNVLSAFVISQATLFLLLTTRFWQRATAVGFYVRDLTEPAVEVQSAAAGMAVPAAQ